MTKLSPWAIKVSDFIREVSNSPSKTFTQRLDGASEWHDENPEWNSPTLTRLPLASGLEWTPSGDPSGIVWFPSTPKGQGVVYYPLVKQEHWWVPGPAKIGYEGPEKWQITGGISRMLGKSDTGGSVTVEYVLSGDYMVPLSEPVVWYEQNHGAFGNIMPIMFAVSALIFGPQMLQLASSIGAAVGATGSLATAIGQVALSTVANGGNVEKAINNYGINFVSNGIGGNIGDVTDSIAIGNATAVATATALQGGNIDRAILSSLIQSGSNSTPTTGVPKMDDTYATSPDSYVDTGFTGNDFTPDAFVDSNSSYDFTQDGSSVVNADGGQYIISDDGSLHFIADNGVAYTQNPDGTTDVFDNKGGYVGKADDAFDWSGFFDSAVAIVSKAVDVSLKVVAAYKKFGSKTPKSATPIRGADGSYTVPNKNGTITITNSTGTRTVQMAAGQPYVFADGSTVINNGDGTITTINPTTGQTVVTPIGKQGAIGAGGLLGNTSLLVFGGLALGLVFMGSRK